MGDHTEVNRTLLEVATRVNQAVGDVNMCLQATYVLVEASESIGIPLRPLAVSLLAINEQTGASVTFGAKAHEWRDRLGHPLVGA